MKPVNTYIVVVPKQREQKTASGLYIQKEVDPFPDHGVVECVADKVQSVNIGDTVWFNKYIARETDIGGETRLLVKEDWIYAKNTAK